MNASTLKIPLQTVSLESPTDLPPCIYRGKPMLNKFSICKRLPEITTGVPAALCRNCEILKLEKKVEEVQLDNQRMKQEFDNYKLTQRAKATLMNKHRLKEVVAFKWLQQYAMSCRMSMATVSQMICDGRLDYKPLRTNDLPPQ